LNQFKILVVLSTP